MLLQHLDMNSNHNPSYSDNDFDSKDYLFGNGPKSNSDFSLSPSLISGPFSNNNTTTTAARSIPALPTLNVPTSSPASWSSSTGLNSAFSSSGLLSSSSMTEHKLKTTQNPFSLNPEPKLNTFNPAPPQQQNRQFHNFVPKQSYHTGAMNNPPMQHSMQRNSDPLETVLGPFPCVRIRGLPFDSNLEDVLVFFQGLVVLDVVVLPHSYNHQGTVGEAFVVFGNPMDFQMALQRNRLSMGNNYLEVYQGKRADYYAAVSSSMQKYNAHRVDEIGEGGSIYDAQQGWSVSGGHHNANPSQVLRAPLMQDMNKIAGGGTTHQLHHSYSKGVMPMPTTGNRGGRGPGDSIRPKGGAGRGSGRGGGIQIGEHTGFLRMRGLPFTAAKGEIFDFFKKYDPILESICLTYRSDGRATGEGYIAFVKPEDAQDAMELHRNIMGSRYIELFISNKEEHGRAHAREASTLR